MKLKNYAILLSFLLGGSAFVKAQDIALKSNILYDASGTINLGAEVGLAPRWTLDVSGNYNGWVRSHGYGAGTVYLLPAYRPFGGQRDCIYDDRFVLLHREPGRRYPCYADSGGDILSGRGDRRRTQGRGQCFPADSCGGRRAGYDLRIFVPGQAPQIGEKDRQ